ncbi:NrpR regulatory domain-containing protein [Geoglobus acetivorans]|uniref:NrpR regulatory domain-containing protein n=1 Tax=Geoglobus acetivorans TaxID=565033 RepID=A0ABZ3H3D6_GEOAI|nr:DUF128 domain-containing protein [Geoglobus acetivorans]
MEILKIVSMSSKLTNSIEIAKILHKEKVYVDSRTVRYHLRQLEDLGFITKIGRKGCIITPEGLEQLKRIMVYERLGMPSIQVEKMIASSTFNPETGKGTVLANVAVIPKEDFERAAEIINFVSSLNVFPSPLIAVGDEGESLGDFLVPENHVGLGCISTTVYDSVLRKKGIFVESIAAGVYEIRDSKPVGFVELITHNGATLSPGELFIKAGWTSVRKIAETGNGHVTAAIKRFPFFFSDVVENTVEQFRNMGIDGVIELFAITPEIERIDVTDASKGRLIVFGGGNYFAPLVEEGMDVKLTINATLVEVSEMKPPDKILS